MDIISSILDGLDNAGKIVPELDKLLGGVHRWVSIFLMIAPVCMLILGLTYLFLRPKEANHRVGYRTYFGMGSVEAWHHTQKIAGIVYGGTGLVLSVIMLILCLRTRGQDNVAFVTTAIKWLIAQIIIVLLIYLGLFVYTAIVFDRHGNRRSERRKNRTEE